MTKRTSVHAPVLVDPLTMDSEVTPVAEPVVPSRPVPESQLSPEQRRIRELEDQLAQERGRKDPEPELVVPEHPGAAGNILIHFLEDGFTALGKVWYRGQELEFEPDSQAYRDTCDRTGRSWLELRGNDFAQVKRWGKVMFRPGPWPGEPLTAAAREAFDQPANKPTEDELAAAANIEAGRRRAAPALPVH